jgi:hypothetical protein
MVMTFQQACLYVGILRPIQSSTMIVATSGCRPRARPICEALGHRVAQNFEYRQTFCECNLVRAVLANWA